MPPPVTFFFYLTLLLAGVFAALASLFFVFMFSMPKITPFYVNGSIVATENCVAHCTWGCSYSGNISVSFVWNQQQLTQSVVPNEDCGYDCCQSLTNSSVSLWVLLPLAVDDLTPIVYGFSVKPPSGQLIHNWPSGFVFCFIAAFIFVLCAYSFFKRHRRENNTYINIA
jgi:hypothetical protein